MLLFMRFLCSSFSCLFMCTVRLLFNEYGDDMMEKYMSRVICDKIRDICTYNYPQLAFNSHKPCSYTTYPQQIPKCDTSMNSITKIDDLILFIYSQRDISNIYKVCECFYQIVEKQCDLSRVLRA